MSKLECVRRKDSLFEPPLNLGMSDSAVEIQEISDELKEEFVRTSTFGERLSVLIERLLEVRERHKSSNWDGQGAEAIDGRSYDAAVRVALSLPADVPIPEVYVRPSDGGVVFEWDKGTRQIFSFEVGAQNELLYSGLYGVVKTFGVEFFYDNVPANTLTNIRRLYEC